MIAKLIITCITSMLEIGFEAGSGFILCYFSLVDEKTFAKQLSLLNYYILQPCMTFFVITHSFTFEFVSQVWIAPLFAFLYFIIGNILGRIVFVYAGNIVCLIANRWKKNSTPYKREDIWLNDIQEHMLMLVSTFSNFGSLPYVYIVALVEYTLPDVSDARERALSLITFFVLPINILFWGYGFTSLQFGNRRKQSESQKQDIPNQSSREQSRNSNHKKSETITHEPTHRNDHQGEIQSNATHINDDDDPNFQNDKEDLSVLKKGVSSPQLSSDAKNAIPSTESLDQMLGVDESDVHHVQSIETNGIPMTQSDEFLREKLQVSERTTTGRVSYVDRLKLLLPQMKFMAKAILNPPIIALFLAIIVCMIPPIRSLFLYQFPIISSLSRYIKTMHDAVFGVSMVILGANIATIMKPQKKTNNPNETKDENISSEKDIDMPVASGHVKRRYRSTTTMALLSPSLELQNAEQENQIINSQELVKNNDDDNDCEQVSIRLDNTTSPNSEEHQEDKNKRLKKGCFQITRYNRPWSLILSLVMKLVLMPFIGLGMVTLGVYSGIIQKDVILIVTLLVEAATPVAMALPQLSNLSGDYGLKEVTEILLFHYLLCPITLTLFSILFLHISCTITSAPCIE